MEDKYTNRLIVFVDILGFSNMVKASKSSPEDSETILKALMRIHAIKENNYSPTFMNISNS